MVEVADPFTTEIVISRHVAALGHVVVPSPVYVLDTVVVRVKPVSIAPRAALSHIAVEMLVEPNPDVRRTIMTRSPHSCAYWDALCKSRERFIPKLLFENSAAYPANATAMNARTATISTSVNPRVTFMGR
jgi:hypothetical protein